MLGQIHHAAVFLTRLPLPRLRDSGRKLADCMWAFPLVGAGLGLAAGGCFAGLAALLPPLAAALVALALLVLATGGLHEDGLADLADGFGGGRDREHRLEIMRDSRTGSYGALAVVFSVALRAAALAALPPVAAIGVLAAAGAASRAAMPLAMLMGDPARRDGLGAGAGLPDLGHVAAGGTIAILVALAALPPEAAAAGIGLCVAAALLVMAMARSKIGGFTGDVLGAVQQFSETGVLLAAAAVLA